ncbi:MAG: hypothetical protein IKV03_04715 [Alphaproteobacteria bacterium]|nr:hypothetical protein [Alphaproteobacteria bacterium]
MKKMLNYIANGKGYGLKYFLCFSLLVCILCWFLFSTILVKNVVNNKNIEQLFSQMPTLEIADGHLIEPKNTYLSIPIIEGYEGDLIINTVPDIPVNLNFASGMYLSTDAMYIKMPAFTSETVVMKWSDVGNQIIDRAALDKGWQVVINTIVLLYVLIFGVILWLGYLLILIVTELFFWVLGYKTPKGQKARAATLVWMGVLTLNFVLYFASLQLSIPHIFMISILLTILLIFRMPKTQENVISGKDFFDTVAPKKEDEILPQVSKEIKPVKVSSQKRTLRKVEKVRREPSKKRK